MQIVTGQKCYANNFLKNNVFRIIYIIYIYSIFYTISLELSMQKKAKYKNEIHKLVI